jgi:hypothetical protein
MPSIGSARRMGSASGSIYRRMPKDQRSRRHSFRYTPQVVRKQANRRTLRSRLRALAWRFLPWALVLVRHLLETVWSAQELSS